MPPKKRLHMTAEQKTTIRAYYSSIHPPPEYKDIGIWFQQKYARPIAASSVTEILSSRYKSHPGTNTLKSQAFSH